MMPAHPAFKSRWLLLTVMAACTGPGVHARSTATTPAETAEHKEASAAIPHAASDAGVTDTGPVAVVASTTDPPRAPPGAPAGMVRLEAAEIEMGQGTNTFSFHAPVYRVKLPPFYLDVHEVTVADYLACVKASSCVLPHRANTLESCNTRKSGRDDHPVNCVNYPEAVAYCAHVGKRLPTEEEWERAARGTDGRSYPWGEGTRKKRVCWPGWNVGSLPSTCPVDMPVDDVSQEGIRGLAGNVSEWTSSPGCGYDDRGCQTEYRITRGGDFRIIGRKGYERLSYPAPYQSDVSYGFRCAVGEQDLTRARAAGATTGSFRGTIAASDIAGSVSAAEPTRPDAERAQPRQERAIGAGATSFAP